MAYEPSLDDQANANEEHLRTLLDVQQRELRLAASRQTARLVGAFAEELSGYAMEDWKAHHLVQQFLKMIWYGEKALWPPDDEDDE